jgi:hypothetical protein
VGRHLRFRWPCWSYKNLARHELDLKVCLKNRPNPQTSIRNVANFSTQWNRDTSQPSTSESMRTVVEVLPSPKPS